MRKPFPPELESVSTPGLVFRCFVCLAALVAMAVGTVLTAPLWVGIWFARRVRGE